MKTQTKTKSEALRVSEKVRDRQVSDRKKSFDSQDFDNALRIRRETSFDDIDISHKDTGNETKAKQRKNRKKKQSYASIVLKRVLNGAFGKKPVNEGKIKVYTLKVEDLIVTDLDQSPEEKLRLQMENDLDIRMKRSERQNLGKSSFVKGSSFCFSSNYLDLDDSEEEIEEEEKEEKGFKNI